MDYEKTILIGLGIVAIALLIAGCAQTTPQQPPSQQPPQTTTPPAQNPPSTASNHDVRIKGFAFSPADLPIKQGDSVIWTNEDSAPHTVKFDFKESSTLGMGDTFSHKFDQKGTFTYHCGIHPSMTGHITVT